MSRRLLPIALAGVITTLLAAASADQAAPPEPKPLPTATAAAIPTASSAPAATSVAAVPVAARRGLAVVLVGPADAPAAGRARELARFAYRSPGLRPDLTEADVRALAGEAPPADAAAKTAGLAAARAAIPFDVDSPSALAAIEELARQAGVRAVALVVPGSPDAIVRIAHTGAPQGTRLDPASVMARPTAGPNGDDFTDVAASVERIVGPPPPPPAPSVTAPPASAAPIASGAPGGPRRVDAKGSKPHGPPEAPAEEENLLENPWFWIVVGAVATAGVTIIVVTQTTDVNSGTVSIGGKVLK